VVSLFGYSTVEEYLLTKHTPLGHRIYKYLGRHFIAPFVGNYLDSIQAPVSIIGIDERIRGGYSHISTVTHQIKHPNAHIKYAKLIASSTVKYAGKTLEYRLAHPRDFIYSGPTDMDVILIDDIITTGVTLQEAQMVLASEGVGVLFGVTIADARY